MAERSLKQLLRVDELRKFVPLSRARIFQLAAAGDLPHYKVGRSVLFCPDEVAAWLAKRRNGGR